MAHDHKQAYNGGCPTLEEQAVIQHEKAYSRVQKQMAKNSTKAADIITWLLLDIHQSVNPANKGKKDVDGNDLYQPNKYKENTQLSVAKEFIANNKEFKKAQDELKAAEKALSKTIDNYEEDYEIGIELTSEETESQRLN